MTEEDKKIQQEVDRHLDIVFMWDEMEGELANLRSYVDRSSMEFKYKETLKNRIELLYNCMNKLVQVSR